MKTYVTFGQDHAHAINDKTFDKDCVAIINCDSKAHGRTLAFEYFGLQFCMEYSEVYWTKDKLRFYPRGYIEVNS